MMTKIHYQLCVCVCVCAYLVIEILVSYGCYQDITILISKVQAFS